MSCSVALVLLTATFAGCLAEVCYTGQEPQGDDTIGQEQDPYRWTLKSPGGDQCSCTVTRLGGVSVLPQFASSSRRLVNGDRIQGKIDTKGEQCQSGSTVSMPTCRRRTLSVQPRVYTSYLPTKLNENNEWKLSFNVLPSGSAQQIGTESIHLHLSSASDESPRYTIKITSNAIELTTGLGQQAAQKSLSPGFDWGTETHKLTIGAGNFELDSMSIPPQSPFVGPFVTGVQFVRFYSDSANGASWNIEDIPCSSSWLM